MTPPTKKLSPDLRLPEDTRLAIVSDVHLGDGSPGDLFGDKDELFVSVLEREARDADALVINGDAVDHVQAHSLARIERAHGRTLAALRALSRSGRVIYVLGNHEDAGDLRAYFPDFEYVHTLAVGDGLCVAHGHQFDLHWADGPRGHGLARLHSRLETVFRKPIRQPFRDYDNWPNRVVHRLWYLYTRGLRIQGEVLRKLGRPERYAHWERVDNFWARGQWGDLGCLFQSAESYLLHEAPFHTLVLGHSHQPGVVRLANGSTYANVGSWALESASYARVRESQVRVFDARTDREYRDERYAMLRSGDPLPDMAGWFQRYYRGLFRYDLAAIERDFPRDSRGWGHSPSGSYDSGSPPSER